MGTLARSPLILIVDDDPSAREVCGDFLRFVGFHVLLAADGKEALALVEMSRPDLVIMDLSMPVLDGWETTRRLKRDPRFDDIPVLVLTAHDFSGMDLKAYGDGFEEIITKPFYPARLVTEIRRLLGVRSGRLSEYNPERG
jgi:CheY-like chemotaxis protein